MEAAISASTRGPATSPTLRITDIGGVAYDIIMSYNTKKDKYRATISLSPKPGTVTVTSSLGGLDRAP